ncbi:tetratricopeptide repeat protein [Streptomyces sp. NPDC089919]|uniref:tetratricopeptide repeat protein n=1 Tax=Streptomyces sp. NPDC089919 TaxID=3155188 RepID=UPI003445F0F2
MNELRSRREEAGLTLRQLAGRAHISAGTLSKITNGSRLPSPATWRDLVQALNLEPNMPGLRLHELYEMAQAERDAATPRNPAGLTSGAPPRQEQLSGLLDTLKDESGLSVREIADRMASQGIDAGKSSIDRALRNPSQALPLSFHTAGVLIEELPKERRGVVRDALFHAVGGTREPAPWPHQVGVIPPAARSFQQRAAEAHHLSAAIDGGGTAVITQVLSGMGGVGKTQLAADYARTAWAEANLDVLVWVAASSREAIVSTYAQAGVELCGADPDSPERAAQTFLAWLTPKGAAQRCRWLVVLDDITDPGDLSGLWPPASPSGRTLVTTRRRDAALIAQGSTMLSLGLFTQTEAVAYLTGALTEHGRDEPADELIALAEALGYLPLALAQAAAYLIDSAETVAAYRNLLADHVTRLDDASPDVLPDSQSHSMAAAWSLSVERADKLRPVGLARPMLQLAALLDPTGIPEAVLTSYPALAYLAEHRTCTDLAEKPHSTSPHDALRALRALHRLSLIDHCTHEAHQVVRVHTLVQRATRDTLASHELDLSARAAADALLASWPDIERDVTLAQALRANTVALTLRTEESLYKPSIHAVLHRAGNSLGQAGHVSAAADYFLRLSQSSLRCLGSDHPDTFTARHHLAHWRGKAGDAAGAAAAFADLLGDEVRVLGPDHPDPLAARHHLAHWRGKAGDAAGAVAAFADLLGDEVRVLGPDHPDTLAARHHLAYWRGESGDPAGAAVALEGLLLDQLRVLGEDHPDTLTSRSDLAGAYGSVGDLGRAIDLYERTLADRVRVLGEDHPDTLTSRSDLAGAYGSVGDLGRAIDLYEQTLADIVRVLGEKHPLTGIVRGKLGIVRTERDGGPQPS